MEIDPMEPIDFDKLIRDKVLEEGNVHSQDANMARSGIWIGVQDKLKKGRFISLYHLAASIALLIVGFSIILFIIQRNYNSENRALIVKMDNLEKGYLERVSSMEEKELQIETLTSNLNNLESRIAGISQQKIEVPVKTVYRTDTIFVKTVEYLTQTSENEVLDNKDQEILVTKDADLTLKESSINASTQIDDLIYPSPTPKNQMDNPEKVKFKLGNIIARKN